MKKIMMILMLTAGLAGVACADVLIDGKGTVFQGRILRTTALQVLIRTGDAVRLFGYGEIIGFARDFGRVYIVLENGTRFSGRYEGVSDVGIIIEEGLSLKKIMISDIRSMVPMEGYGVARTEVGVLNSLMLMGYGSLNDSLTNVSSGALLSSMVYGLGVYVDQAFALSGKLSFHAGMALSFLPDISADMSISNVSYGKLFVNSLRVVIPLDVSFSPVPRLSVGLGVAPSFVLTSIFQNYDAAQDVNSDYKSLGLEPRLTVRYEIAGIGLSLTAGYEIFALDNGMKLALRTGIVY